MTVFVYNSEKLIFRSMFMYRTLDYNYTAYCKIQQNSCLNDGIGIIIKMNKTDINVTYHMPNILINYNQVQYPILLIIKICKVTLNFATVHVSHNIMTVLLKYTYSIINICHPNLHVFNHHFSA